MNSTYDLIGIGFGPSNIALAVALADRGAAINNCFIERKATFNWHGNMLLEGSDMQISFLKDLVTLRNPQSPFTFISYLHEKRRLTQFINLKTFYPSRTEFNDYLDWVARKFEEQCHYNETVVAIEPEINNGRVDRLRVRSHISGGRERVRFAHNLSIGVGGTPALPNCFAGVDDTRIFHSSAYLQKAEQLIADKRQPLRVAVIGSGQSAAEIYHDLGQRFSHVNATLVMRAHALKPADDSPFINEIFNPDFVDTVYGLPAGDRAVLLDGLRNTNYSVVDPPLIEAIYRQLYEQKVAGRARHAVLSQRQITNVNCDEIGVWLNLQHALDGSSERQRFDIVILATGYSRAAHLELLAPLQRWLGDYKVERNYRLRATADFAPGIYLQGSCEASHGLSDTLLSLLPVRANEIADSLLAATPASTVHEHGNRYTLSTLSVEKVAVEKVAVEKIAVENLVLEKNGLEKTALEVPAQ